MNHDSIRYGQAIIRNLFEIDRCLSYRNAYNELMFIVPETNWSFFSYASLALYDGMISHAIKVLDSHKEAASFLYLYHCQPSLIKEELKKNQLRCLDIVSLAIKLKNVRDKTHFHIDKKAVFDSSTVWKEADIKNDFFNHIMDKLWIVLKSLHLLHFDRDFIQPIYNPYDIKAIIDAVKAKDIMI